MNMQNAENMQLRNRQLHDWIKMQKILNMQLRNLAVKQP